MQPKELTPKQKRFIELYDGNAAAAARAAGYSEKSARIIAKQLMDDPRIVEGIRAREDKRNARDIATANERKKFWTAAMRDGSLDMKARLRASELLGKSEGDFIDRKEITGKDGAPLSVRSILSELEQHEREAAERSRMIEKGAGEQCAN